MRRGLAGLLGLIGAGEGSHQSEIKSLPISVISPSPYQAREGFSEEGLEALAESIRTHGVVQPVIVRRLGDNYQLVAGERRLRASQMVGRDEVPAIIRELSEDEAALISLTENVQRENLTVVEEARGYRAIVDRFGMTVAELAKAMGKSESAVATRLRILGLGDKLLSEVDAGKIHEGHLMQLLRLDNPEDRRMVLSEIQKRELSVKETSSLIDSLQSLRKNSKSETHRVIKVFRDARLLVNTVKKAVRDMEEAGVDVEYAQASDGEWIELTVRIRNGPAGTDR